MVFTFPALQALLLYSLALATASASCVSEVTHDEFASFHGAPISQASPLDFDSSLCGLNGL
jgi:hypothetical protein